MFELASLVFAMDSGKQHELTKFKSLLSISRTPFDKREECCQNTLGPQLKQLDAYMAGHSFVAGETLSYVDFMFWEILDHMYRFDESLFRDKSNLIKFKTHFEALPNVAAYIKSPKFMIGPCNNKMAKWGNDPELKKTW